jgi:acyl-CoA synthetase (AMP-forming)/AMP-acid ligase II
MRLGTVGREWAGSGPIRLLDPDGREVPDGEVGELYSRTPYVFDGYWKNPEKTAEAFHGDALRVRVGLGDFNAYGFDMFYHLENLAADKEIARVKTGIVFFDYQTRKIAPIPAAFIQRAGLAELVAAAAKESA